jgi:hypothetical protein
MFAQKSIGDDSLSVVGRISNLGLCGNGKDAFQERTITDSNVAAAYQLRIETELKKFLLASPCLTTKTASKQVILLWTSY